MTDARCPQCDGREGVPCAFCNPNRKADRAVTAIGCLLACRKCLETPDQCWCDYRPTAHPTAPRGAQPLAGRDSHWNGAGGAGPDAGSPSTVEQYLTASGPDIIFDPDLDRPDLGRVEQECFT